MVEKLREQEMTGREIQRVYCMNDGAERSFVVRADKDVAVTVAFDLEGMVLLCRQFRPGQERFVDDPPGGMAEPGEDPETTAARELLEETGYEARELMRVCAHPMVTNSTRTVYGFLARGCKRVAEPALDDGEHIELVRKPLPEFVQQVARGLVSDYGAAQAALLRELVPMLGDGERAAFAAMQLQVLAGLPLSQ
ncbi:NUDIX hydrolase [Patescibacteria group bacterium]|nr:MAG: NUDIX hydrolase [Patescibacteria group bacterium]